MVKPTVSLVKPTISAAIIVKNAASTIKDTLTSVSWMDEVVVVDSGSTDKTVEIAKKFTRQVFVEQKNNFSLRRNLALSKVTSDWVFYIDADEVMTDELRREVLRVMNEGETTAWRVTRRNYFLGTLMYPDKVERLFLRSTHLGWKGRLHETPQFEGNAKDLVHPLIHHTHTDITSMLEKTNYFSEFESDLRIEAKHPPMAWWRLVRIALTEGWRQFVQLKVWKFGRNGLFEGYFQMVDKLVVYTKLWEKQHVKKT